MRYSSSPFNHPAGQCPAGERLEQFQAFLAAEPEVVWTIADPPTESDQYFTFEVCNNSGRSAVVAVSGKEASNPNIWMTRGWYSAPTGRCTPVGPKYVRGNFYAMAEVQGNPSLGWKGSDIRLCVGRPGPFSIVNTGRACDIAEGFRRFAANGPTLRWPLGDIAGGEVPSNSAPPAEKYSERGDAEEGATQPNSLIDKFAVQHNRDIYGHDIPSMNGTIGLSGLDFEGCEARCDATMGCAAISFDRWNNKCYLKDSVAMALLDARSTIAVKKPLDLPSVSAAQAQMETVHHRRFRGDIFAYARAPNFSACSTKCDGDLRCVAFTFLKQAIGDNCRFFGMVDSYELDDPADGGYKYQPPQ